MRTALLSLLLCAGLPGFAQTANPSRYKYVISVTREGSGDCKHIRDATDAMRVHPLQCILLYTRNGTCNEKIGLADNPGSVELWLELLIRRMREKNFVDFKKKP